MCNQLSLLNVFFGRPIPQMKNQRIIEEEEEIEIPEEEEEQDEDIIVIDEELISAIKEGIEKSNPQSLAQGVDVILGIFEYKKGFILDEDLSESPIITLIPLLNNKLCELHKNSADGSAKKEKVTDLLEKLAAAIFDSFLKFKKENKLFKIFCKSMETIREFAEEKVMKKAYSEMLKAGTMKENYHKILFNLLRKTIMDEQLQSTTLQLLYIHMIKTATSKTIETLVPKICNFCIEFKQYTLPFIKHLIKKLASELLDLMQQSRMSFISWSTIATLELISGFIIETKEKRLIYPFLTIVLSLLKNFPIKQYLPFQIHICLLIHTIISEFDFIVPILSWMVDAIHFICTINCKGKKNIDWDNDLISPQTFSYEFCNTAIERIKKLFLVELLSQSTSISFPEFIYPIRSKLESILHSKQKNQVSNEIRQIVKIIKQQEDKLVEIRNGLKWTKRDEQLALWKQAIAEKELPLQSMLNRQNEIEEKIKSMKEEVPEKKANIPQLDDTLTVATVDDV